MAREYDASKEQRTPLVEIQKNNRGEFIVASKIKNTSNGNTSLDIRQYYTNEEGVVCPTSKGIRLNAELALELTSGIVEILEANELMDLRDKIDEILGE